MTETGSRLFVLSLLIRSLARSDSFVLIKVVLKCYFCIEVKHFIGDPDEGCMTTSVIQPSNNLGRNYRRLSIIDVSLEAAVSADFEDFCIQLSDFRSSITSQNVRRKTRSLWSSEVRQEQTEEGRDPREEPFANKRRNRERKRSLEEMIPTLLKASGHIFNQIY